VGEPDGQQALYLNQIDSPADELKIPPRKINYRGLTFSPDNQALYVVEKDEALMGRLFAVPLLGRRPNSPIERDVDGPISFSPKGDSFVYVRRQQVKSGNGNSTLSSLIVASRDGRTVRPLVSTTDVFLYRQPVWSPDGKRIAVFLLRSRPQRTGESLLDLVGLDGSESRRVLADWQSIGQPQWTPDGKSLVVSVGTYSQPNKRSQLHQLSVVNGADHLLTNDLASFSDVSLSADGREMTAVKTDAKAVVWISQPNDFTHGSTLPAEAEKDPSLAWSDAAHLIVDSRRNGFPNIGLLDAETQSFIPLTNEQFMEQGAALVPGSSGKSIVFASNRSGEFHIWRFDEETNKLQQLTFGPNYDERPSLSPDGQWIVYASWVDNVPRLMKVRSSGGPSTQIGNYSAEDPQVSPDGKWIACYLQDPATKKWSVAIVPFEGDSQPRMVPLASVPVRWSPDGGAITASRTSATGVSNIWRIPLNGDAPKELTDFEDRAIFAFAWSPSGDRLACLRGNVGADVALFKNSN
jgi:TolB protein